MMDTDAVLEEIACDLERPNLLDMAGLRAKRKRDREDASLRAEVRQEQRREMAGWIRSFKSGKGNDPAEFLRRVRDNPEGQHAWGPEVAACLAAELVTMTVTMDLSTHLPNCEVRFGLVLTEAGQARAAGVPVREVAG